MDKAREKSRHGSIDVGLGGILKGLGDLVEKLQDLEERGEVSRSGSIGGEGDKIRGIYGFTVKVGLGDQKPRIEPFGNIRRDTKSGRAEVQEVREPMVDVFDEDHHLLVVAELPGVRQQDVKIELTDDLLTIVAEHGEKKYRKEVLLPRVVSQETMQMSCNNGVLEVKWPK